MTGIEPDEILDPGQGPAHHDQGLFGGIARTMGFLAAAAYGMSKKIPGTARPYPGEFSRNFNRVCKWFACLAFSPYIIAIAVVTVIVIINALGGDHNNLWHRACDLANANPESGWCHR